jgi:hypothetical protein
MIAACDLKYATGVRVNTLLHVFHPGPVHADGHMVFGLAGYGAGVTANALAIIDDKAVVHP